MLPELFVTSARKALNALALISVPSGVVRFATNASIRADIAVSALSTLVSRLLNADASAFLVTLPSVVDIREFNVLISVACAVLVSTAELAI